MCCVAPLRSSALACVAVRLFASQSQCDCLRRSALLASQSQCVVCCVQSGCCCDVVRALRCVQFKALGAFRGVARVFLAFAAFAVAFLIVICSSLCPCCARGC